VLSESREPHLGLDVLTIAPDGERAFVLYRGEGDEAAAVSFGATDAVAQDVS